MEPSGHEPRLDLQDFDKSPTSIFLETNMADPFEVRMRFSSLLQHLNASITSSQKAAHYALKYRDMDEDLHSCILEQLERVSSPPCDMRSSGTLLITARTR